MHRIPTRCPYDNHYISFLQNQYNESGKGNPPYHVKVTHMMAQSSAHEVPAPPAKDFLWAYQMIRIMRNLILESLAANILTFNSNIQYEKDDWRRIYLYDPTTLKQIRRILVYPGNVLGCLRNLNSEHQNIKPWDNISKQNNWNRYLSTDTHWCFHMYQFSCLFILQAELEQYSQFCIMTIKKKRRNRDKNFMSGQLVSDRNKR